MTDTRSRRTLAACVAASALLAGTLTAGAADTGSTAKTGDTAKTGSVQQNDLLNATLWMQHAVEYKATVEGIYDLAKIRLDEALKDKSWTALPDMQGDNFKDEPTAIIADLDETFIDNSAYEASLITRGTSYSSKDWTKWVQDEKAKAMPGVVDFLKYADSKGVKIFYISNRSADNEEATRANLKKLGFPMGGNVDTVLAKNEKKDWGSDKDSRHKVVAKDYRVLLVMGDNLGDFTDKADGSVDQRMQVYKDAMNHWGHDWIMLPNPSYGSWESTSFGGDWSKSEDERRKEKIDRLSPWQPSGSSDSSSGDSATTK
ncbi:5'-nucleotidase, lipoprotein e(P4) family [Pararhizobium mangrovi]|uniref:5'-nucleotidase, lipoprotein e(P4) family n=1 Tax=Pararhizobium mangrovi TaxID=2590452 RepID=A0A506UHY0_9HYPH|nr:5'-nucleotidase, lipoprotein e(P4) family [Pararhizobium mangrovi]TPW32916.1 5'-nucleotidase, lipoprotein e(P4) family [Pararhizobium mangrovi]